MWHIPHESEPWEIILVRTWDTHHSFFPFESDAARLRVRPESGDHMETLAFYFPVVGEYEAAYDSTGLRRSSRFRSRCPAEGSLARRAPTGLPASPGTWA